MSQQELKKIQNPIAIPEPTNQVDALWRTCQALKEAVEVLQGIRGNRAAALKVELDNLGDTINTGGTGGGGGVDTFVALLDTNLTGQAIGDLVYNADATNWFITGSAMRWFPTTSVEGTGALTFTENYALDWTDAEGPNTTVVRYASSTAWLGGKETVTNLQGSTLNHYTFANSALNLSGSWQHVQSGTGSAMSPLNMRDRAGIYREAGYANMKLTSIFSGTANITREYWHTRINCGVTSTLTLDAFENAGVTLGAVLWIQAEGGDVTLASANGTVYKKFLGAPVTTGNVTIVEGGWATLVKASFTDYHITGVGVQ